MVASINRADTPRQEQSRDAAVQAELRGYRMPSAAAILLDVSASGAMLRAETAGLRVGDEVVLVLGAVQSVATICWLHEEACGITFHRRLHAMTVDGLRRMTRH